MTYSPQYTPEELESLRDEYREPRLDDCRGKEDCDSDTCRHCYGEQKARANQRRLAESEDE